jgi:hypothetical protein
MLLMDHKGVFGTNFGMSILWSLYPRKLVDPLLMPGYYLGKYWLYNHRLHRICPESDDPLTPITARQSNPLILNDYDCPGSVQGYGTVKS